jgi:hypothetical protein
MSVINASEDFVRLESERRQRKEMLRAAEDRVLDPWERYRAVADHCDRLHDVTELYDRKTRFALIILGTLNAMNVLLVTKGDVKQLLHLPLLMNVYIGCYALLSIVLLWHAIAALSPAASLGEGVRAALDEYCDSWKRMHVGELNRQLATASYRLEQTNAVKLTAVMRLYGGLKILAVLTALFVVALAAGAVNLTIGF